MKARYFFSDSTTSKKDNQGRVRRVSKGNSLSTLKAHDSIRNRFLSQAAQGGRVKRAGEGSRFATLKENSCPFVFIRGYKVFSVISAFSYEPESVNSFFFCIAATTGRLRALGPTSYSCSPLGRHINLYAALDAYSLCRGAWAPITR